jgi:hypothetical protein
VEVFERRLGNSGAILLAWSASRTESGFAAWDSRTMSCCATFCSVEEDLGKLTAACRGKKEKIIAEAEKKQQKKTEFFRYILLE